MYTVNNSFLENSKKLLEIYANRKYYVTVVKATILVIKTHGFY